MSRAPILTLGLFVGVISTLIILECMSLNITVLHNAGLVKSNINVYWDIACTNKTEEVDWGELVPGQTKSITIYVVNNKNSSMTLTLGTEKWSPSQAEGYIHLTWDYIGTTILPYEVQQTQLILTVNNDIHQDVTDFNFHILITGHW